MNGLNSQNESNYFVVSGSMGSGKTTLCQLLSKQFKIPFIEEPFLDNPFLPDVFKDVRGSHFKSQMFFLIEHWKSFSEIPPKGSLIIKDSSLTDGACVYTKSMFESGKISQHEWDLYNRYYNELVSMIPQPKFILYIRPTVDTLYKRIMKRNRSYEKSISKGYLRDIQRLYDDYIASVKTPCLTVHNYERDDITQIIDYVKNQV